MPRWYIGNIAIAFVYFSRSTSNPSTPSTALKGNRLGFGAGFEPKR